MIFNTASTSTATKFPIEMGNNTNNLNICKRDISADDTSAPTSKKQKQQKQIVAVPLSETDGSSIEITKRPRGRPPGSKNKPKPPVIITRETDPSSAMRPHVLEIPAGHDVIATLIAFSRRKNIGICVLAGNGSVSNVTLRQPPHPASTDAAAAGVTATVGFGGRFEILSMSATVMPPAVSAVFSSAVAVSLAGPQGQVIGGTVVGPLMAAGMVTLVAGAFENPTFHRLPAVEDDVSVSMSVSGGGDENQNHHHQQQQQQVEVQEEEEAEEEEQQQQQHYLHREYQHPHPHHHHHPHHAHHQSGGVGGGGVAVYGSHFTTDVMWPPTARQPHPPPPPHY